MADIQIWTKFQFLPLRKRTQNLKKATNGGEQVSSLVISGLDVN